MCSAQADLVNRRKVEADEAMEYAREQNLIYIETSAKEASNVEKLFVDVSVRARWRVSRCCCFLPSILLTRAPARSPPISLLRRAGCQACASDGATGSA